MKKAYIIPTLYVRNIQVTTILADSELGYGGSEENGKAEAKFMDFYENDEVSIAEDETPL